MTICRISKECTECKEGFAKAWIIQELATWEKSPFRKASSIYLSEGDRVAFIHDEGSFTESPRPERSGSVGQAIAMVTGISIDLPRVYLQGGDYLTLTV